jgi:hypothetical protein
MKRLWAVGALLVPATILVATSSALPESATGDTCTATGSGTTYTLQIKIPPTVQQFGFAFRVPGATVTNAVIPSTDGSFSTETLAPNTSGAWLSPTPLTGASTATVTTSGPISGTIMVVPSSAAQSPSYFDPVACRAGTTASRTAVFSVGKRVTYTAAAHAWRLAVAIPGAGTVSAKQLEPTIGTGSAKPVTAKPLVQVRRAGLKSAGKVMLVLKPTARGSAALKANGSMRIKLDVTFDSRHGKSATKIVALTLHR